jgi:hypothetical protein
MKDNIPALLGELPEPYRTFVRMGDRAVPAFLFEPLDDGISFNTTSPVPWTDYLNNLLRVAWKRQNGMPAGILVHPATKMDLIEEWIKNTPLTLSYGLDSPIKSRGIQFQGITIDEHLSVPEGVAILMPLSDFYPNGEVPLRLLEANGRVRLNQLAAQKLYQLERDYEPELNLMMLIPEEHRFIMDAKTLPNPRVRLSAVNNLKHRIQSFLNPPDLDPVAD